MRYVHARGSLRNLQCRRSDDSWPWIHRCRGSDLSGRVLTTPDWEVVDVHKGDKWNWRLSYWLPVPWWRLTGSPGCPRSHRVRATEQPVRVATDQSVQLIPPDGQWSPA